MIRACPIASAAVLLVAAGSAPAETFKLATGNDYKPFADESLPGGGIAARIVRQAFAERGHQAKIAFMPWKRGYREARKGSIAATFPYIRTPERAGEMRYSQPLVTVKTLVVSKSAEPIAYDGDPAALRGHGLCEPQGYSRQGKLGKLIEQGAIPTVARPQAMARCARLVQRGRADFLLANNFTWRALLRDRDGLAPADFRVADTPIDRTALHLIAGKTEPRGKRAVAIFDAGLRTLRAKGKLKTLLHTGVQE